MTGATNGLTVRERLAVSLLPGVPVDLVLAAYATAPGNEIESGKFASPESSAALAANVFGWFLERPAELPALRGTEDCGWPARSVRLEAILRFPWSGGRRDMSTKSEERWSDTSSRPSDREPLTVSTGKPLAA